MIFPPYLQAPHPAPAPPPQAQAQGAEANLPPGFKDTFRYVIRPWGWVHLGSLGPEEKTTHTWELENLSDKPITFKVSDLSPGVLVLEEPFKESIPAHGRRRFTIQADATGWEGFQQRGIRLVSDDPTQPSYKVLFDMTVRPDLTVDAVQKNMAKVAPYESPQASFHFKRETGTPLEVKRASELPPYVEGEVVPLGAAADLRLTLRASKVPTGQLAGLEVVKVTTNAPQQPSFDLYLNWAIHLPVMPNPSRAVFDDPKVKQVKLTLKGDHPFKILSAKWEAQGFALGPLPSSNTKTHVLTVRRLRDDATNGMLVLTFSGVQDPLSIPVIWADPAKK